MKQINLTLLFSFLLTTFSFAQEKPVNPFLGIWELGLSVYNGQNATNPQITQLKEYRADSTFNAYIIVPGDRRSVQTMAGTYSIQGDSVYTETIVKATNTGLIGDSYTIVFYREGDQLRLKGNVEMVNPSGNNTKVFYNERWDRLDFPE
ncbi:uncharacterized protein DUF4488 [Anseongella ginsenosidimutans]|uniref:Uncharacterized protein DUF4488 n=1 Tax=Anseongella ginsenosidimutans TaxID=496056 RepID=A0A4R3KSY3_9SPHI|nr:DUF4488 domain-containing protein [Anseongella ginsenosidimutans]QEC53447.1 DUF4488 domain-containing protein [Anseongella ginsenosidimutans]TCS88338.1 uncharacterized protein DUF4488 [Anseongella ginsenosidimutans]